MTTRKTTTKANAISGGEGGRGLELVGDLGPEFGDGLEGVDLFVGGFAEAAEAALAVLVVGDGFEEVEAAEVGPEAVGDEDLGVGDLPEEEVGDALLAGGADDEVGVGHVGGVEGVGDGRTRRCASSAPAASMSSTEMPRWWASVMRLVTRRRAASTISERAP